MDSQEFAAAHARLQEIGPQVKSVIASMTEDQKKRYDKKAERKVMEQTQKHRNKLQQQFNEIAGSLPNE